MQTKRLTLEELKDMIRAGELKDGLTLSALQLFDLHLNKSRPNSSTPPPISAKISP